ncbi:MAG: hypothetical protein ACTSX7_12840 [Alphaproteobacteria bacterium]
MAAAQHIIQFDGKLVGHAISLDTRYVFYTAARQLKHLDERRFNSVEEVRVAVTRALKSAPAIRLAQG